MARFNAKDLTDADKANVATDGLPTEKCLGETFVKTLQEYEPLVAYPKEDEQEYFKGEEEEDEEDEEEE